MALRSYREHRRLAQKPNYTFDRFIGKAEKAAQEIDKDVKDAEQETKALAKKKSDKEKANKEKLNWKKPEFKKFDTSTKDKSKESKETNQEEEKDDGEEVDKKV